MLICLSDINPGEGFFASLGSHGNQPQSFLRQVQDPSNTSNKKSKLVMIPSAKLHEESSYRIPLKRADILVYNGNLSYYM